MEGLNLLPDFQGHEIRAEHKADSHWYRLITPYSSDLLPSVTTVLNVLPKPFLVPWAKKVALQKVREVLIEWFDMGELVKSVNDVEEMLEQARTRPDEVRDQAADEGTSAHALVEAILAGAPAQIPAHLEPAVNGALRFITDYNLTPIASEATVWHPIYRYAGTVDLVARDGSGNLVVCDWKRSSGIYESYAYQVGAYAGAIECLTGEEPNRCIVVRLPRETGPKPYEAKELHNWGQDFGTYLSAQRLWSNLKRKPYKAQQAIGAGVTEAKEEADA